jgi:hypothetical protein
MVYYLNTTCTDKRKQMQPPILKTPQTGVTGKLALMISQLDHKKDDIIMSNTYAAGQTIPSERNLLSSLNNYFCNFKECIDSIPNFKVVNFIKTIYMYRISTSIMHIVSHI